MNFNALRIADVEDIQKNMLSFMGLGNYDQDFSEVLNKIEESADKELAIKIEILEASINRLNSTIAKLQARLNNKNLANGENFTEKIEEYYNEWNENFSTVLKNFSKNNRDSIINTVKKSNKNLEETEVDYEAIALSLIAENLDPEERIQQINLNKFSKFTAGFDFNFIMEDKGKTRKKEIIYNQNLAEIIRDIKYLENNSEITVRTILKPKKTSQAAKKELKNLELITADLHDIAVKDLNSIYKKLKTNRTGSVFYDAFQAETLVNELCNDPNSPYSSYFKKALFYIKEGDIAVNLSKSAVTGAAGEWYWTAFFLFLANKLNIDSNKVKPAGVRMQATQGEVPIDIIFNGLGIQVKNYSANEIVPSSGGGWDTTLKKLDKESFGKEFKKQLKSYSAAEQENKYVGKSHLDTFVSGYGFGNLGAGSAAIDIVGNFLFSYYFNKPLNSNYKTNVYDLFNPIYNTFTSTFIKTRINSLISADDNMVIELTEDTKKFFKEEFEGIDNIPELNPGLPDFFATRYGLYRTDKLLISFQKALIDYKNYLSKFKKEPIQDSNKNFKLTRFELNDYPFEATAKEFGFSDYTDKEVNPNIKNLMNYSYVTFSLKVKLNNIFPSIELKE